MSHNSPISDRIGYRMARHEPAVKPDEETSAHDEASVGVMVDHRDGVMAANMTEELRARRLGEVVMAFSTKVDARFPPGVARELNTLRQRSNAAADGTGDQLTDDEQARLDELAGLEVWFGRMSGEQRRRLDELARADAVTLEGYNSKAGWP